MCLPIDVSRTAVLHRTVAPQLHLVVSYRNGGYETTKDYGVMTKEEKILELAADVRKFEIGLFWQRSLFFWGFIAAAFVAYAELAKESDNDLRFIIACFGLVCSLAWTLGNRGSKYWQEAWELKVESVEQTVLGVPLFSRIEDLQPKGFWGGYRYSVSKLAIALSDFTVIIWILLAAKAFPSLPAVPQYVQISVAVAIGTAIYIVFMLVFGRSGRRTNSD